MKLFFASDLHGCFTSTQQMLEQYQASGASHLMLLGDLLHHGPRNPIPDGYAPVKVAEVLNQFAEQIIAVRGNCESEVDQMLLEFSALSENHSVVLADGRRLFLTHGHLNSPDELPRLRDGDVLVYGHTHIPQAALKDRLFLFNPGSVTLPRDGYQPSYGLLNQDELLVKGFDGEVICRVALNE